MLLITNLIATDAPPVQLLQDYCNVYEKRDLKKMKKLFAKKTFSLGTGRDEILNGWSAMEAQLKRDWTQSKTGRIELHKPIITANNWASCTGTAHITLCNGEKIVWPNLRMSIVVTKENSKWKIAHTHASVPAIDQPEGRSFPSLNR